MSPLEDIGRDALSITVTRCDSGENDATTVRSDALRTAASTQPQALAGALAYLLRGGNKTIEMSGVGPSSVLKMTKACAMALRYLHADGVETVTVRPRFIQIRGPDTAEGEHTSRSAVVISLSATWKEGAAAAATAAASARAAASAASEKSAPAKAHSGTAPVPGEVAAPTQAARAPRQTRAPRAAEGVAKA